MTIRLSRFFFVLPEPLPLPDGYQHVETVGDAPDAPSASDDPAVSLIFHQVESGYGRVSGANHSMAQVLAKVEGLPLRGRERPDSDRTELTFSVPYTVVEAVTAFDSPDPFPESGTRTAASFRPRADGFARCLRLVTDVLRAYRQATEVPLGLPSYERVPSPVFHFGADGLVEMVDVDGTPFELIRPTEEWSGPQLMLLDHVNLGDPMSGPEPTEEIGLRLRHWLNEIRTGNPLSLWRERYIEARRALEVMGEYGQAVTLANTSSEVLLDVVLALLMWEESVPVSNASSAFEEGKVLRRVTRQIAPRLKGNWSTSKGPVGDWFQHAYRLRHRVVHGGYLPTADEASQAFESAQQLQQFVMDRLADRRTIYPRAALMTLGEPGLRSRDLWAGQIKRFAEEVAPSESNWRVAFTTYHRELVAALSPSP